MVNVNHNHEHDSDASEPGALWVSLLGGLLIGTLVGAGSMWLLAPQSGEKTRASLQRQSHELREQTVDAVKDATSQVRGKAHQITEDMRQQAETLGQRGQAMFDGQRGHQSTAGEAC